MPEQPSDKSPQEQARDLIDQAFGRKKKDDRSFTERVKDQMADTAERIQEQAKQGKSVNEQQPSSQQGQGANIANAAKRAAENAAEQASSRSAPATNNDAAELESLRQRVADLEREQPAAPSPAPARQPRTYTVKSGDSLSLIAKRFYGDPMQWKRIYEANRDKISNPDLIHPGEVFVIPE